MSFEWAGCTALLLGSLDLGAALGTDGEGPRFVPVDEAFPGPPTGDMTFLVAAADSSSSRAPAPTRPRSTREPS